MFRLLKKALLTGIKTEELAEPEQNIEQIGAKLEKIIRHRFSGSLAIRFVDAGSCNACELEANATSNSYYDIERFGIHYTPSPRFADMLLVSGPVTRNMETALKMTYEAMPKPKLVVALGDCATNCGVFGRDNYAISGAISDIIPVDVVIHGCPPSPTDIIAGIHSAIK